MKLRNKKTGEIDDYEFVTPKEKGTIRITNGKSPVEDIWEFDSLAELFEHFEDYKSKEPLIEDKEIREIIRAWADVNGINRCVCKDEMHCITFETERGMFISFENADPIPPEGNFTITELCGEEDSDEA